MNLDSEEFRTWGNSFIQTSFTHSQFEIEVDCRQDFDHVCSFTTLSEESIHIRAANTYEQLELSQIPSINHLSATLSPTA